MEEPEEPEELGELEGDSFRLFLEEMEALWEIRKSLARRTGRKIRKSWGS